METKSKDTKVKYYADLRGLSVSDVARATGINRGSIHKLFTGETKVTNISLGRWVALSRALGVKMLDLV